MWRTKLELSQHVGTSRVHWQINVIILVPSKVGSIVSLLWFTQNPQPNLLTDSDKR